MASYSIDTSALAKLYHAEIGSERMESLVQPVGTRLIISQLSRVEMLSAFATKFRTGVIDAATLESLIGLYYSDLASRRFEVVQMTRRHFLRAETLIRTYAAGPALRALDALQLSVTLDLHRRKTISAFVSADKNLGLVAALEGLTVINRLEVA